MSDFQKLRETEVAPDHRRQVAGHQGETGAAARLQPVANLTDTDTPAAFTLQYDSGNRVLRITFAVDTIEPVALLGRSAMERFIAVNGPCMMVMDLSLIHI